MVPSADHSSARRDTIVSNPWFFPSFHTVFPFRPSTPRSTAYNHDIPDLLCSFPADYRFKSIFKTFNRLSL